MQAISHQSLKQCISTFSHGGIMVLSKLIKPWKQTVEYQNIKNALAEKTVQLVVGLTDLPRSCWSVGLKDDLESPMMVVTATSDDAKKLYANMITLLSEEEVIYYPELQLLPYEVSAQNMELIIQRISAMAKLHQGQPVIVITPVEALVRKVIPPNVFGEYIFNLKTGQNVDVAALAGKLVQMGYVREELVEVPGTFSIRGGIIDVFPLTEKMPLRIELFDDEIESIRSFEPGSQRSKEEMGRVQIIPAREILVDQEVMLRARASLEKEVANVLTSLSDMSKKGLNNKMASYLEHMTQGMWTGGMEQFLQHFYPESQSILEYLPPKASVILHEPDKAFQTIENITKERESLYYDLLNAGQVLPSFAPNFLTSKDLKELLPRKSLLLFAYLPERAGLPVKYEHHIITRDLPSYKGQANRLAEDLKYYRQQGYRIMLSASSSLRLDKMKELMRELGIEGMEIINLAFPKGFESNTLKLVVFSETEILGQEIHRKSRRIFREGEKISTFLDLKVGDLVVHVNHGIGRYLGVERLDIGGVYRDYLHIQYAGDDKLYVPSDQIDLIQKYVGSEGRTPKLYKLGGTEWNRVKNKVRHSVQDMAKELLELYAAREAIKGYAFTSDTVWQREFEDEFPYPETQDQLRSIEQIKKDMEKVRPMDRLLCGDVGYGKTEVALRAAFKAVMDGKQVAVLVPTTVLAQQHQHTFEERLKGFPVSIGALSRFKTPKMISQVLDGVAKGSIDIVIGTHRLLSDDVSWKDIGLLIIDEEQRFGVAHKEKLKTLKQNIDVLTLSATPIPRTLHMALVSARDMSVIETPPEDRLPVQTYVVEYNEQLIRDAISREISRGGQVYVVHNKVKDIYQVADEITRLVPEAETLVGHGQMREHELESVMLDFIEGKANVLVCTTIVESGLDIPNVNTLIVNNADHMGLSQLYQLRGRVGRSNKQAFAYFTYRKDKILTEVAKKRLAAIRDFTELGSGFKIAMRDLEIRGAGNILGPEQHGQMMSVGFDLYCKLLEEEVKKLQKGKDIPPKTSTLVELEFDAFIPDTYLQETELKMDLYKRLVEAEEIGEIDDLELEAEDRYGVMPDPVRNLFKLAKVRVLAQKSKVTLISQKNKMITIRFGVDHNVEGNTLGEIAKNFGRRISFSVVGDLEIKIKSEGLTEFRILQMLHKIFELLIA